LFCLFFFVYCFVFSSLSIVLSFLHCPLFENQWTKKKWHIKSNTGESTR
jgi:hypothetical protein